MAAGVPDFPQKVCDEPLGAETGNTLLMGHVTTLKGVSRFKVEAGWQGKGPDRMKVRGFCSYKVTMPAGQSFAGETLLIDFSDSGVRAIEAEIS